MSKHFICIFLLLFAAAVARCGTSILQCNPDGSIQIGGLSISVLSKEDSGRLQTSGKETIFNDSGFTTDGNTRRFHSEFRTSLGNFQLQETLREEKLNHWTFSVKLSSPTPIRVNELSLLLTLPGNHFGGGKIQFDGREMTLPAQFSERLVLNAPQFKTLAFRDGENIISLSGSGNLIMQDERCDGWDAFTMRSYFDHFTGMVKEAEIRLNISIRKINSCTLDMKKTCNMGFADETAGDGKGGWTDQGGRQ